MNITMLGYCHNMQRFHFFTEFILVSSGVNCEASGYQTVTSEAECHAAVPTIKSLEFLVNVQGTVETSIKPSGCYHRFDGDLWYNTMVQSPAHCSGASKCVCITKSAPPPSSGKRNTKDSST